MDWDNLRYFLELARTGTLAAAARRAGVEHTTVARRIQALEKQMGAPLFAREAAGHRLTEAGRHLLPAVEAMEAAVLGVERASPANASAAGPSGLVRVGATEGFGTLILAPHLARLTQRHPHLSIDLLALPRMLHLSRREADIVISLERPKRGSVIVTRLADYTLRLYGQREYLARRPLVATREDLRHHAFISYVDDLLFTKELQFLGQLYPPERFALRSTSITAQYEAVRAGAGLAVLPAFLADRDPILARVLPHEAAFTRTFWMSMPAEAKHLARMQAVWAFLKEVGQKEAGLLVPDAPHKPG
ncbi:LysR family transcriptional regulator [Alicycliphilus denitrificans]|uniref:LysR family transcriptional regulator n=1 Tax=Alicycliphilus denitrificans TaxID=179636 RepID=UPI000959B917|nr:LysR family transcriptional regulator [Alicycliphilus denitrificans]MBN9572839.1 LysR family transcriptional regulator [Alicycliphilus denitrificans]OJW91064.1 MAG: LysR family transcriptional regulator [Alicycliphilus sp. 69-12]BCN39292.1 LysR family transcriptional regulator [Alicycliphilus denitrificans]